MVDEYTVEDMDSEQMAALIDKLQEEKEKKEQEEEVQETEEESVTDGVEHIAYMLNSKREQADKILLKGENEKEYFDGKVDVKDGGFEYNGQTRVITEAGTFVDKGRLVSFYKDSKKEPETYVSPKTFSAEDLRILRREETTFKGIMNAVGGDSDGLSSSRMKSILIVIVLAAIIFGVMFVLPKVAPSFGDIPIIGW
jgi:hypothetical protein